MFGLSFLRARREQRDSEAAATAAALGEAAAEGPEARQPARVLPPVADRLAPLFGAQFGGATLAFLWPSLKGGFGSVINAGKIDDIKARSPRASSPSTRGPAASTSSSTTAAGTEDVDYEAEGVTANGIMPLYQRCVHLGCRVPFCAQSQWFECPCHGSKYNTAGEYKLGPAPRGMDRFRVTVSDTGDVLVDTAEVILGPPRGADTLNKPQSGPFCVAPG